MKISLDWLKEYVDFKDRPEELAERLTMAGLEVEGVENFAEKYKKFVVGEVLEVTNHPNAAKLTLCKVNVGSEVLKIVCGAPNVSAGQKVAVGLVGAIVPRNQYGNRNKPLVLRRAEIRGEISEGMICSAYELDLGEDSEGILILEKGARVGAPLAGYLGFGDTVFDIGVTPNRPDCLSHVGVAREVAAFLGKRVKFPKVKVKEIAEQVTKAASVKVEQEHDCPRYSARVVRDVKIGESPEWMKGRLRAVGLRPINNIVDITNYVLMELGHPLHAFDYDKLEAHKIIVRRGHAGERFSTLDGVVREVRDTMLLICDQDKPIAIAGVIGASNTEISDTTQNVLIEGAYFDPTSIRRTSKQLGISTEASQRFERGTDPHMTTLALDRAVQLLEEIAHGRVLRGIIDKYPRKFVTRRISLRINTANKILGTNLSKKEITQSLSKLEIVVSKTKISKKQDADLSFIVPTFRPDIMEEIDLIEEIARVYGYDKIETKMKGRIRFSDRASEMPFENTLREWLIAGGYHEVVANSMQEKSLASLFGGNYVEMLNPINKDMGALRTSLASSMLQIVAYNLNHGVKDLKLFEIGNVYFFDGSSQPRSMKDYREEKRLLLAVSGKAFPTHWNNLGRLVDVFDIKGELETLFSKIFLDKVKFIYYSTSKTLTDLAIGIEINKTYIGYLGRVNDKAKELFDLKQDVFVGEISLEVLQNNVRRDVRYRALPKYPSVTRDLAFVVNENQAVEELIETMLEGGGDLVQSVELFDMYVGENVGMGKKSCAFTLQFMSRDHTLTDREIEQGVDQIVSFMGSRFQATLRSL